MRFRVKVALIDRAWLAIAALALFLLLSRLCVISRWRPFRSVSLLIDTAGGRLTTHLFVCW